MTTSFKFKFQVSSLFLDNYLHITFIHTHPQVAKLIEAGLCLSKLKESIKEIQIWKQNRNNNNYYSLYKSNIKKRKELSHKTFNLDNGEEKSSSEISAL